MSEQGAAASRYLQYLPPIYWESDFLGRFLHIFEELVVPVEDILNEIHHYFDPRMAPPSFLSWLASWIDLALDENWPEHRRRELIHRGTDLYRWRGTRRGMRAYLQIYAGVEPEIIESPPKEGRPFHFTVSLQVKDPASVDEARIRTIIEEEKPAHTTYTLEIESSPPRTRPTRPAPPAPAAPAQPTLPERPRRAEPPAQPEPSGPPAEGN